MATSRIAEVVNKYHAEIWADWVSLLAGKNTSKRSATDRFSEQGRTFLGLLREALLQDDQVDLKSAPGQRLREFLDEFTAKRVEEGFTPSEVATFVFSLKEPIFNRLRIEFARGSAQELADEMWRVTVLIDKFGLYTTEVYQRSREKLIERQQQDMLELSTPVVRLWEGIVALPLIGTLDSARTQIVMQNLLEAIVQFAASVAILDITGVPTVDTLVAQHLLKTVAAARLMGADCIISGIRPQIAQTIIHLGVELSDVTTKATLAEAFQLALKRIAATKTAKA